MIEVPASRQGETTPAAARDRGPGEIGSLVASSTPRERLSWHVRLAGFCLLLVALPFLTAPGQIIADSKFELAVDPARFLSSALTLWNSQQFGQLQDQAVGYLFPMGPFFELGRLAVTYGWVVQRLWISAVLIAAFTGTVRLAGRLGIGTPWTRIVAGFAYALSPAALSMLGEQSAAFLPAAMLPWILLPLVDASQGGASQGGASQGGASPGGASPGGASPGKLRAAAGSALAVALCGGVNGAATVAVLIPAVLYILSVRGWRLLAWWVPAVVLATVWWTVPLLLQVRYGASIVPDTESAASATGLSNVLRGTGTWLTNGRPGYKIATEVLPTLLTGLVAALGLAGLIRRGMPARSFLLTCSLAGLLIITAGHVSSLGNPAAGPIGEIINGPAAAFRDLWKFDPLIRLPVALGLARILAAPRVRTTRITLVVAAVAGVGGLAVPACVSGLAAAGSFAQVPSYWVSAANWVSAHAGDQAVLVAPGVRSGQYVWGSPMDDVLASLTNADFAERDPSVIGSPGNERLLDAINQQLAAGTGSAGLAQVLARMGVGYVVVRNDLSRTALPGTWPSRIIQALETSPGITSAAQFGPQVGHAAPGDATTSFDPPYPAVEIYRVAGSQPTATVQPAAGTLRVYGAPESLLTLAGAGLLAQRPVLINNDGPGVPVSASVLTGTGLVAPPVPGGAPSAVVLAKAQPPPSGCMLTSPRWVCSPALVTPTEEQFGFDQSFQEISAERASVQGSAIVTNSSVADRYARSGLREATVTASSEYTPDPQDQPRSVFDGDPATSWIASPGDQRPRLTIRWGYPRKVSQVTIQRPPGAAGPLQVLMTGSGGPATAATVSGATAVITFHGTQTTSLAFTFTPAPNRSRGPVQISGVAIPGVPFLTEPTTPLRLPCGLGPQLSVNGTNVPTQVSGTFNALLTGQPVQFSACGPVALAAGVNRVVEPSTDAFDVQNVVLGASLNPKTPGPQEPPVPAGSAIQQAPPVPAAISSWTPARRVLRVSAETPSYLVVDENFNAGWQAVIDGRRLPPVRLDGWKQAWRLPAGTSGVITLTYQPQKLYRYAVVGGLSALGLILLLAAWPFARPSSGSPAPPTPASASQRAPSQLRRLGQRSWPVLVTCVLAAAGFWFGGYPGAAILPVATLVFLISTGYRGGPSPSGLRRCWLELLRPRVLVALLLVASACSAAGERLMLADHAHPVASALASGIPQVICLVIVGRLVAALIIP